MRIFVAGATGAIGRRLVPLLVSAGHSVVGLTRTPAKAAIARASGAEAAVADGLARVREWLPALARMLDAKPPFNIPAWIPRFLGAEHLVTMMTQGRAGSNAKAKLELRWHPAHPSWRRGFAEVVARQQAQARAA